MEDLQAWLAATAAYQPLGWEQLPDLDLYMDQVITLMDKQLTPLESDGERLLTPSMINNYVKDGALPRPVRKKYARRHLALLTMICSLKPVLSLPEIHRLLHETAAETADTETVAALYADFAAQQERLLHETAARVTPIAEQGREACVREAMQLALEANARRLAAARLLASLEEDKQEEAAET